jgi:error-prone DNA polymerase
MLERGHDRGFAERVFRQIQGFGEYGFPESHAASFALLVYVSAWIKRHEPAAFYCGLLNSLPMGFYSPSQLVQDATRHHIRVYSVDVQHSDWEHRLEPVGALSRARSSSSPVGALSRARSDQPPLRLGLRMVKGLSEAVGQRIAAARPFTDAEDLARRAGLSSQALRFLARAGALQSLAGHRYQAHWEVAGIREPIALEKDRALESAPTGEEEDRALESAPTGEEEDRARESAPTGREGEMVLPPPSPVGDMLDDYRYLGLTLGGHPLALLRGDGLLGRSLARCHTAASLTACRHGQFVRVTGLVTGRQRPGTASGVLFVTLEDETGNINLVVWASVLEQFRAALLQGRLLRVKGVVERDQEVIHVVAGHVEDVSELLTRLASAASGAQADAVEVPFRSRDFQ